MFLIIEHKSGFTFDTYIVSEQKRT